MRESIIVIDIMTIIGMVHGEEMEITGDAMEIMAMAEEMAEAMAEEMAEAMAEMVAIRDRVNHAYK
jgi:ATP-dependent protease ClpP protease subunit